jgi:protein TonB
VSRPSSSILLPVVRGVLHRGSVVLGASALTLAFFLVLPLLQRINPPLTADLSLTSVDTTLPPPPPPPPQEEPEEEEEPEEPEPPDLSEETPPLDLSQLELALNPGLGGGWFQGDFAVGLDGGASRAEQVEELFSLSDLDQQPKPIFQPSPRLDGRLRSRGPGQVFIIFIVDADGRVEDALVQKSSDPIFERPALAALRQWKFEPGRRNGEPVRFRMRQRFDFPGN